MLFLLCSLALTAQNKVELKLQKKNSSAGTTICFGVFNDDLDQHIQQLRESLGRPQIENTGRMVWKSQEIDGLGKDFVIQLSDGLMSMDTYEGCAYWELFKNEPDKTDKLKRINAKNWRYMELEITDASGGNLVHNPDKVTVASSFLLDKLDQ